MKVKTTTLTLLLMLFGITLTAQNVSFKYTYDKSGNRTKREVVPPPDSDITLPGGGLIGEDPPPGGGLIPADPPPVDPPPGGGLIGEDRPGGGQPEEFSIQVYPNPSNGVYTVELPNLQATQKGMIQVYSSAMVLVQEYRSLHAVQTIDITSSPPGYYALAVIIGTEIVGTAMLIKQ